MSIWVLLIVTWSAGLPDPDVTTLTFPTEARCAAAETSYAHAAAAVNADASPNMGLVWSAGCAWMIAPRAGSEM